MDRNSVHMSQKTVCNQQKDQSVNSCKGKQWMFIIKITWNIQTYCVNKMEVPSVNPEAPVMSLKHYFALNN